MFHKGKSVCLNKMKNNCTNQNMAHVQYFNSNTEIHISSIFEVPILVDCPWIRGGCQAYL